MCGIYLYIHRDNIVGSRISHLKKCSQKLHHRGPDQERYRVYGTKVFTGFHRLAIMDPTEEGLQPFESPNGRFVCMVNGEIFNHEYLRHHLNKKFQLNIKWKTNSDCEVVVHLFQHLVSNRQKDETIHDCFSMMCELLLDGEFSIIIYDQEKGRVYYGTDELSVRPLFIGINKPADEVKGIYLTSEQKSNHGCNIVTRLKSGHTGFIDIDNLSEFTMTQYINLSKIPQIETSYEEACSYIRQLLIQNVDRKIPSDRECGFLLSGGLDSSLVAAIASRISHPIRIKTFTVGFSEESTDILAARKVAKKINSIHHEFICTYQEGIDILPRVIKYNESWDQTTTRASVPMALCVKKIKEKYPDIAVIYSGEVADELLMGYLYNRKCPSDEEGKKDQIKRLEDIHCFDGLRADRVCASYSCELRLPFFGKDLLRFVLSLPHSYICPTYHDGVEKHMLRQAFDPSFSPDGYEYLPYEILWRTKNAMSDATSVKSGWKDHLKQYCDNQISDSRFEAREELFPYCTPQTKEDMYYRELFEEHNYTAETIPYKWMSSWCDPNATDSSASTIDVFQEDNMK